MKKHYLLFSVLAVVLLSCGKTPDYDLGDEFHSMNSFIDMSQSNKYNEALFCNSWVTDKIIYEQYHDGQLVRTADHTDRRSKPQFTLYKNHTLKTSSGFGTWLYSHNYIMMKTDVGDNCYEVVEAQKNVLHLRCEIPLAGGSQDLFFVDPSGTHVFYTYQLKKQ